MRSVIVAILISVFTVTSVNAFEKSRAKSWEFYLGPQYTSGKTLEFDGGATAEINDQSSFAFGFGYNFDKHVNIGMMFNYASTNYEGTAKNEAGETETFVSNMSTSTMNFTATYNILEGDFTPYVTGNFGLTYIDSGISSGDRGAGCWWDPWYGYVCYPYETTYSSSRFNYGGQIGLRYDFGNALFIKGGAGINYVDLDTSNSSDFIVYNLSMGFLF